MFRSHSAFSSITNLLSTEYVLRVVSCWGHELELVAFPYSHSPAKCRVCGEGHSCPGVSIFSTYVIIFKFIKLSV